MRRALAFALLAGILAAVGCSSGDDDAASEPVVRSHLSIGQVDLPAGPVPATPEAIRDEIAAALDIDDVVQTVMVAGPDNLVWVNLGPGRDGIAEQLFERYQHRIGLGVGRYRWPLNDAELEGDSECATPVASPDPASPVTATLSLAETEMPFAEHLTGTLTVHNGTDTELRLNWGGGVVGGVLRRSGEPTPAAAGTTRELTVANGTVIEPGATSDPISVSFSPHSCSPHDGTAIQPGRYEPVVALGPAVAVGPVVTVLLPEEESPSNGAVPTVARDMRAIDIPALARCSDALPGKDPRTMVSRATVAGAYSVTAADVDAWFAEHQPGSQPTSRRTGLPPDTPLTMCFVDVPPQFGGPPPGGPERRVSFIASEWPSQHLLSGPQDEVSVERPTADA